MKKDIVEKKAGKNKSAGKKGKKISLLKKAIMEILFLNGKSTASFVQQNMKDNYFFKIQKKAEISSIHRNFAEMKSAGLLNLKREEARGFYRYLYFLTKRGKKTFEAEMKKEEENLMPGFVEVDLDEYCAKCSQDKHSCFKEKAELLSKISKKLISPSLLKKYLKYPLSVIAFIKYKESMEILKTNKKMADFWKKIYLKKAVSLAKKGKKPKNKKDKRSGK